MVYLSKAAEWSKKQDHLSTMSATSKPVESITIVGGGTAGWLAANLLSNYLGTGDDDGTNCRITLIESPNIATVGVGEATVPAMPRMLRQTGISEREFFKATNASFKLGVRFANWNHDAAGKPIDYINPFIGSRDIDGIPLEHYFHTFGAGGMNYVQAISATHQLGELCKGPRALGKKEFEKGSTPYAYHLDAGKFAGMLKKSASNAVLIMCAMTWSMSNWTKKVSSRRCN